MQEKTLQSIFQATKKIEAEIGTEDLLSFFKMEDRNAKNPKKTKNK